jgi:hypothetical protein
MYDQIIKKSCKNSSSYHRGLRRASFPAPSGSCPLCIGQMMALMECARVQRFLSSESTLLDFTHVALYLPRLPSCPLCIAYPSLPAILSLPRPPTPISLPPLHASSLLIALSPFASVSIKCPRLPELHNLLSIHEVPPGTVYMYLPHRGLPSLCGVELSLGHIISSSNPISMPMLLGLYFFSFPLHPHSRWPSLAHLLLAPLTLKSASLPPY